MFPFQHKSYTKFKLFQFSSRHRASFVLIFLPLPTSGYLRKQQFTRLLHSSVPLKVRTVTNSLDAACSASVTLFTGMSAKSCLGSRRPSKEGELSGGFLPRVVIRVGHSFQASAAPTPQVLLLPTLICKGGRQPLSCSFRHRAPRPASTMGEDVR